MRNKNKGFTLTELLIVVMVIGILATVIVPKFNNMLLDNKVLEAENILTSIRQEQVLNCATYNQYNSYEPWRLSSVSSLKEQSDGAGPYFTSKYFAYEILNGHAMAGSLDRKGLILRIFYEDGRICRDDSGNYVGVVNRYPKCNDLLERSDFKPSINRCCGGHCDGQGDLGGSSTVSLER